MLHKNSLQELIMFKWTVHLFFLFLATGGILADPAENTKTDIQSAKTGSGRPLNEELEVIRRWTAPWKPLTAGKTETGIANNPATLFSRNLPFRFNYNNRDSRTFIGTWKLHSQMVDSVIRGGKTYRHVYTDKETGLRITWDLTVFEKYPAVDWVLRFENTGTKPLPVLTDVQAADITFGPLPADCPRLLHTARGGIKEHGYAPRIEDLSKTRSVERKPVDGRSSNPHLPFFNLQFGNKGAVVALGWSGQWKLKVSNADSHVRLAGGLEFFRSRLNPGESIRTPRVLLVYWAGVRLHGQNLFRRVLRDHYCPLLNGKRPLPIVQCNSWFPLGHGEKTTADLHISYMQAFKGSGIEHLVMDAGWYSDRTNGSVWRMWNGTWHPNKKRFPQGLSPIAAAGKESSIGFGLWFEPERVVQGTRLFKNHPKWMLHAPPRPKKSKFRAHNDAALLNLGITDAQEWFVKTVSTFAEETPLSYFRHDYNHFDSLKVWKHADSRDRTGITETRYVLGLYRILDQLHRNVPAMVMEGCASGGRRIDLETLRRSHLYWKCDAIYAKPEIHQSQLWDGLQWLPGGFLNTQILRLDPNPYWLHSTMGGSLCVGWNPTHSKAIPDHAYFKDAYDPTLAARQVLSFKAVRHLFDGDYFPLTPYTERSDRWIGWQFHREDLNEGMAVVFRRTKCKEPTRTIRLHGTLGATTYRIRTEGGTIEQKSATGVQFQKGVQVKINTAPGSILIHYKS